MNSHYCIPDSRVVANPINRSRWARKLAAVIALLLGLAPLIGYVGLMIWIMISLDNPHFHVPYFHLNGIESLGVTFGPVIWMLGWIYISIALSDE